MCEGEIVSRFHLIEFNAVNPVGNVPIAIWNDMKNK